MRGEKRFQVLAHDLRPGMFSGIVASEGGEFVPSCGETKVPRELRHSDSGGRSVFEAAGKKG